MKMFSNKVCVANPVSPRDVVGSVVNRNLRCRLSRRQYSYLKSFGALSKYTIMTKTYPDSKIAACGMYVDFPTGIKDVSFEGFEPIVNVFLNAENVRFFMHDMDDWFIVFKDIKFKVAFVLPRKNVFERQIGLDNNWSVFKNVPRACGCDVTVKLSEYMDLYDDCGHVWHNYNKFRNLFPSVVIKYKQVELGWIAKTSVLGKFYVTKGDGQLRDAICTLVNTVLVKKLNRERAIIDVEPNMLRTNRDGGLASQDGGGPQQIEGVQHANVVITSARADSMATGGTLNPGNENDQYFTEEAAVFPHLTERALALPPVIWNTSDVAGAIIADFMLPIDFITNNLESANVAPYFQYAFSRPEMTLYSQLQSIPANGGQLVVGFRYVALDEDSVSTWKITHVAQLLQTDHVILSAQSSNSSELDLVYQHYYDRVPNTFTADGSTLYVLNVKVGVLNPLVVSTGSPVSVTLTNYVAGKSSRGHTKFYGQRNYFNPFVTADLVKKLRDSRISKVRNILEVTENGVLDVISDVVAVAAPVLDVIEPGLGTVVNEGTSVAKEVVGFVDNIFEGKTPKEQENQRPLEASDHSGVVLMQNPGLAISDGSLSAKSMRLTKALTLPFPRSRFDEVDQFSNKYLCSIFGLIDYVQYSESNNPGDILYQHDVTPIDGVSIGDGKYQYTPTGHLGLLYTYYSGDLEYKLVLGSGILNSGRIRLLYIVDYSDALITGLSGLEERNIAYSAVYDLQEQTEITFKIPYQVKTPVAPLFSVSYTNNYQVNFTRYAYGRFVIIAETALQGNNAAPSAINIAVLQRGGNNFQYAVPTSANAVPISNIDTKDRFAKREVVDVVPNMEERNMSDTLLSVQPSGISGVPHHLGESYDIKDLVKRMNVIAEQTIIVPAGTPANGLRISCDWPINSSIPTFRQAGVTKGGIVTNELPAFVVAQDGFRFNRGTIRDGISISCPVPIQWDIYHLPYVVGEGPNANNFPLNLAFNNNAPLDNRQGSGIAQEFLDTRYNSMVVVEWPFIQPVNSLIQDVASSFGSGTTSTYSNGRAVMVSRPLTLEPGTSVTVTLYRSVGNDFKYFCFQGFPPCGPPATPIQAQPAGRMPTRVRDFRNSCVNQAGSPTVVDCEPNMIRTVRNMKNFVKESMEVPKNVNNVMLGVNELLDKLNNRLDNFNSASVLSHIAVILDGSGSVTSKIAAFFGVLANLGVITVSSVVNLIRTSGAFVLRKLASYANNVGDVLQVNANGLEEVVQNVRETVQENSDDIKELCILFSSSLAAAFGLSNSRSLSDKIMSSFGVLSRSAQIGHFFELLLKWVDLGLKWVIGEKDPNYIATKTLGECSRDLKQWAREVDELCAYNNQDRVFSTPDFQLKMCRVREQGMEFFFNSGRLPQAVRPAINQYFRRINELYDNVGLRVSGGTKQQEAVCVWVYGKPGAGKSNYMDALAINIMRSMKIVYSGDPIYTRDGNKYWNGLHNQPCVKFDDVGVNKSQEWTTAFISDFFNIMSCASFNPEQADMRDKNRVLNCKLVMIGSNYPTFTDNAIGNEEAFRRRRDVVLCVRLNEKWLASRGLHNVINCNDPRITADMLKNFDHLEFRLQDPLDKTNYSDSDGFVSRKEIEKLIGSKVMNVFNKRKAAAERRQNLTQSLTAESYANLGINVDDDNVEDLQPLSRDIIRLNEPSQERSETVITVDADEQAFRENIMYYGRVVSRFIRDRFTRGTLDLYSELAGEPGEFAESLDVEMFPEWESLVDMSRVSCLHKFLNGDCEMIGNSYRDVNGAIIPVGQCENCCLTDKGCNVLYIEYCRTLQLQRGARINNVHTPENIRNFIVTRPSYNLHNLIDSVVSVATSDSTIAVLEIVAGVAVHISILIGIRYGLNTLEEAIFGKFDHTRQRVAQLEDQVQRLENSIPPIEPNLAVSADVRTQRNVRAPGRLAVRRVQPLDVKTNGINPPPNSISRNLVKLVSACSSNFSIYSIHGLGYSGRSCLVPKHFFNWLKNDVPVFMNVDISKQTMHSLSMCGKVAFPSNVAVKGPLCMSYNLSKLYAWNSMCVESTPEVRKKYEIDVVSDYIIIVTNVSNDSERVIEVVRPGVTQKVKISNLIIKDLPTEEKVDMVVVELPPRVAEFKNITSLFVCDNELDRQDLSFNELIIAGDNKIASLSNVQNVDIMTRYRDGEVNTLVGYTYRAPSGYFPCGSVLWNSHSSKILGLHVAAVDQEGFSMALTKELLIDSDLPERVEPEVISNFSDSVDLEGQFFAVGAVENGVGYNPRTNIVPSILNKDLPSTRYPAKLMTKGEDWPCKEALKVGAQKQCVEPPLQLSKSRSDKAKSFLHQEIIANSKPVVSVKSKRSLKEVICGIQGIPFMDSIKLNTSSGYPFNAMGLHSKSDLIRKDDQGNVTWVHPKLMKQFNFELEQRLKGVREPVVFTDFLKDERLKPGKETRLINGSPIVYTLIFRMYFLDFIAAFQAGRFANNHAIGMNVHGPEVTKFMNELRKKGTFFVCSDYKNFGPTLDPDIVEDFCELANEWYSINSIGDVSLHNKVRKGLIMDLSNSYHLIKDLIYLVCLGSPSGGPATAPINSYVNLRYIDEAWLEITKNIAGKNLDLKLDNYHSLRLFRQLVKVIVYGDDLIISTNEDVIKFFNNITLSEYFSTRGIIFTDSSKTGNVAFCDETKADFLKHTFIPHPTRVGMYLAAHEVERIWETPAWVHKTNDMVAATAENIRAALLNAHGHGPAFYDEFSRTMRTLSLKHNIKMYIPNWQELDDNFFDPSVVGFDFRG